MSRSRVEIAWVVELEIQPELFHEFGALTGKMLEAASEEPETLIYERFISSDSKRVIIYERYANDQAALKHLAKFKERFGDQLNQLVIRRRFWVLGEPGEDLLRMFSTIADVEVFPMLGRID